MTAEFDIGGKRIGDDAPPLLLAEIAQAHDGSVGIAHSYVDLIADLHFDAVKFQIHDAESESTREEPFRTAFSYEDATRKDYWRRTAFDTDAWAGLVEHARRRGLLVVASVFSSVALAMAERLSVDALKVASGEVSSRALLGQIAASGVPVLLSTGMSSYDEIDAAVALIRARNADVAMLQCTSKYPTALADVGLNVMDELRERHQVPVGLSDHSGSVWPGVAALSQGAALLEVHAVFERRLFGPDASASLTPKQLEALVEARDAFEVMRKSPVDKDTMARTLAPVRVVFGRSVALVESLPAGTVLRREHLTYKKPASGLSPDTASEIVGRRLVAPVRSDRLLRWVDLED